MTLLRLARTRVTTSAAREHRLSQVELIWSTHLRPGGSLCTKGIGKVRRATGGYVNPLLLRNQPAQVK